MPKKNTNKCPTIVINVENGMIQCVNADMEVRVILIDNDTEGYANVSKVDGQEVVVNDYRLDTKAEDGDGNLFDGLAPKYVKRIAKEVDKL